MKKGFLSHTLNLGIATLGLAVAMTFVSGTSFGQKYEVEDPVPKDGWHSSGNSCDAGGTDPKCRCLLTVGGSCSVNIKNGKVIGCADTHGRTCGDSTGNPHERR